MIKIIRERHGNGISQRLERVINSLALNFVVEDVEVLLDTPLEVVFKIKYDAKSKFKGIKGF